jgi:dihydrodipicolinate synthase/N-acetylneuraminate lyase
MYMGSGDQAKIGFLLQAMNLVFTSGDFNGSTLALLGRNCPLDAVRELAVVGGTGAFRFASGYAHAAAHALARLPHRGRHRRVRRLRHALAPMHATQKSCDAAP